MLERERCKMEQREVSRSQSVAVGLAVHIKASGLDPEGSGEPVKGITWPRLAFTILKGMHLVPELGLKLVRVSFSELHLVS